MNRHARRIDPRVDKLVKHMVRAAPIDSEYVNTVVNTTENAMSSTDIFISNWFDVC